MNLKFCEISARKQKTRFYWQKGSIIKVDDIDYCLDYGQVLLNRERHHAILERYVGIMFEDTRERKEKKKRC